ncbi:MAG: methionyl-tRNA formyltransferase [Planctomycetota bacterium]|jgi:methionyl-tRNA formyltransferase
MKLVYLGSGEFGIECLNAIIRSDHNLEFIVTQPARGAGRGKKTHPTPVASWAMEHSIPFIDPEKVNSPEVVEQIKRYEPDVIVVAAFGQMIGTEIIAMPKKEIINVHGSVVPKYRGAAPINWAIINGESKTGISIIRVVKKMDAGDVLDTVETKIEDNETAGQLHDRLAHLAAPILIKCLNKIADGSAVFKPQDESQATIISKLKKTDGYLDFSEPAGVLDRKIRGLSPWPGATANYISNQTGKITRVIISAVEIIAQQQSGSAESGTLDNNLNVICSEGALKIKKIKPAGKVLMDFSDFVNGHRTRPGDKFEKIKE